MNFSIKVRPSPLAPLGSQLSLENYSYHVKMFKYFTKLFAIKIVFLDQ